ncbi:hypothetical protein [Streptococcus pneumoniae]|nr:hypothetical protein [Streptococcus pneumoniae]
MDRTDEVSSKQTDEVSSKHRFEDVDKLTKSVTNPWQGDVDVV